MEALTLRYFLKIFSSIFLILIFYTVFITFFIKIYSVDKNFNISKGENIESINNRLFIDRPNIDRKIYLVILKFINYFDNVHYGDFLLEKNLNLIDIIKIITLPSNINYNIRLINGWYKYQLNEYLNSIINENFDFDLENVISDTYIIQ